MDVASIFAQGERLYVFFHLCHARVGRLAYDARCLCLPPVTSPWGSNSHIIDGAVLSPHHLCLWYPYYAASLPTHTIRGNVNPTWIATWTPEPSMSATRPLHILPLTLTVTFCPIAIVFSPCGLLPHIYYCELWREWSPPFSVTTWRGLRIPPATWDSSHTVDVPTSPFPRLGTLPNPHHSSAKTFPCCLRATWMYAS